MASTDPVPSVVIDRPGPPASDVIPVPLQPVVAILIRVSRTFIQVFLGALGVGAVTSIFPTGDFQTAVIRAAGIAAASAFLSLLQNSLELLTKLDVTNPQLRA